MNYIKTGILVLLFVSVFSIDISAQESKDSSAIIKDVKKFSEKDNPLSWLLRTILVFDEEGNGNGASDTEEESFNKFRGKTIRKVEVMVLDVFGPTLSKPERQPSSWLQKTGNSIHINSKEWLIRNKLLFSEGSKVYPFLISESERLLRQANFIYDASITLIPVKKNKDSVDVRVMVQDVWSITGSTALRPDANAADFSLKDLNFLGFGTELSSTLKFDDDIHGGWTWNGSLAANNIFRNYLTGRIYYFTEGNDKRFGFGVNRDFYSPVAEWAGGFNLEWLKEDILFFRRNSPVRHDVEFNQQDLWLGHATSFKDFDVNDVNENRFTFSIRTLHTNYTRHPSRDSFNIFHDNTLYLGRIGYAHRRYQKDRYIFGLGKTEDIPVGGNIALIGGVKRQDNIGMPYAGIQTGYSSYFQWGFLYGGAEAGSFINSGELTEGVVSFDLIYFSKLTKIGRSRWRHYIWNRYSYGFDKIYGRQLISINGSNGIRGFSNSELLGDRKLVVNYENNIFLPLTLAGFRLALISFADMALLAQDTRSVFAARLYSGFGVGVRIRNEHLIFPTIQLMAGYYPSASQGSRFEFYRQSSIYYHLNHYQFSRPDMVGF